MNIKSLITTSVVALISASGVQAADVVIPHETAPVISAPSFSWTGFYIGGQIGGFSSKIDLKDKDKDTSTFKDLSPKLSGLVGGIYAGSNFDLSNGIILGVETDMIWSGKKDVRVVTKTSVADAVGDGTSEGVAFKQKWAGATRVRIGFAAADRIMPYVAGGAAYTQLEAAHGLVKIKDKAFSTVSSSETATMVGFTIGGGLDFAVTDNVLLRAEYRYSGYGKKKFFTEKKEYNFSSNDFRVGVAYKF
ncbi:outer membrane protein [Bartonella florencae]|uniref:outer membrane protein n=1 Tax=Bartonella florencae TaxID=928210 RepID=UPI00031C9551|nr:outer membrane protein [Bartonella florencae]